MEQQKTVCLPLRILDIKQFIVKFRHRLTAVFRCHDQFIQTIFANKVDALHGMHFVTDTNGDCPTVRIGKCRDNRRKIGRPDSGRFPVKILVLFGSLHIFQSKHGIDA